MGRRDLTEQRTAQILDAFARCISRFGLEGSTLERVADEAGMRRSMIRHYVGNRDQLILALTERVLQQYEQSFDEFERTATKSHPAKALLDFFLPTKYVGSFESVLVIEALLGASDRYPVVRRLLTSYIERLVERTARVLLSIHPHVTRSLAWQVAFGIVSISFNHESLGMLNLPGKYLKAARQSVQRLIDSLSSAPPIAE